MSYGLYWLEGLAAGTLFVALIAACAARIEKRWKQLAIATGAAGLPFLLGAFATLGFGMLKYRQHFEPNWFFYVLSGELVFGALSAVVLVRGLRRQGEAAPAAAAWPRLKLLAAFAVALGLQTITLWNMDAAARARFDAARVEAGALALSVAPARLPDAQNAALVYRRAFEAYVQPEAIGPKVNEKSAVWYGPMENVDFNDPDLVAFLAKNAPAMALLRRGAALPGCNFERDYGRPDIGMLLPDVSPMRQGVRMLKLDAGHQASKGNARAAFEDLAAIRGMTRHQGEDCLLITALVTIAMKGLEVQALEGVLAHSAPTAGDLALLPADDGFSVVRTFGRSLRMEEAFGLATASSLSGSGDGPQHWFGEVSGEGRPLMDPVISRGGAIWRVFFLSQDLAYYRQLMGWAQKSAVLPPWEMRARMMNLETEFEKNRPGILTSALMPALAKTADNACRSEAQTRIESLALAATAYKLKTGKYPEKLEPLAPEFIPAVPVDPFDGQPLRMVAADGGVVLYSVGPDGKDDGGKEFDKQAKTGDITFCLGGAYKARREKK